MCIHGQDRLRQDGGLAAAAGAGPRPCPDPSARRPSGRTAGGRSAGHERRRGRRLPRQGLRKGAHAGFTHIDPACPCSRHRLITDRHATPQSMPLLNAIPRIRGVRGRPRHRLGWLFMRPRLRLRQVPPPPAGRGITPKIAHRGVTRGSGLGRTRWVVERTFGWLHQFKRLRIRYEIRTPQASGSARALPMPTCRA